MYLPELSKPVRPRHTAGEHIKVNTVLSAMTIVVRFTLSILMYGILAFRPDTHPLIYITGSLLFAMGIWQTQTFWRTLQLRTFLKRNDPQETTLEIPDPAIGKLVGEADLENMVLASVTDRTTREPSATKIKSS